MVYTYEQRAALQRNWLNEKVAARVAALEEAVREKNQPAIKKFEKQVKLAKLLQEDGLVLAEPSRGVEPEIWNIRTAYGTDIPSLKDVFDVVTEAIITDQKAAEPDTVMPRLKRVSDIQALLEKRVTDKSQVSGTKKELAMLQYEAKENFEFKVMPGPDDIDHGECGWQNKDTGAYQWPNILYRTLKPDSRDWKVVKTRCQENRGLGGKYYQAPVTALEDVMYCFIWSHIHPDKNGKLRHQGRISTMEAMRDGITSEISTNLCKALIEICPCHKRKSKDLQYQNPAQVVLPNKRLAEELEKDAGANEFEQPPKRVRPNEQPPSSAATSSMDSVHDLSASDSEEASPQSNHPNDNEKPGTPNGTEAPEVTDSPQDIATTDNMSMEDVERELEEWFSEGSDERLSKEKKADPTPPENSAAPQVSNSEEDIQATQAPEVTNPTQDIQFLDYLSDPAFAKIWNNIQEIKDASPEIFSSGNDIDALHNLVNDPVFDEFPGLRCRTPEIGWPPELQIG
ncbi:hypothetical protein VTL71DRAFT_16389 [Oculimacula yallundae]|uniref:Uncharacterized protein n=1 Tax=Oculimacula yallundae TaxID=86028 RepID=A0ABR4CEA0_9HELO